MNLGEKNVGSKPCWHDNRDYSKQSTVKKCLLKKIELLEFKKNREIMIDLILNLILNLYIYNFT